MDYGQGDYVGQLATILAHEVKNPLSLIKANIDYLELCDNDKIYSKNYIVIKNQLQKTNDILLEFLNLVTATQDSFEYINIIQINKIIKEIISEYKSVYKQFKLTIRNKVRQPEKTYIFCDKKSIAIAFRNIVKNAVEACIGLSGEEIIINVSVTEEENGNILYSFADNGPGLDEQTLFMLEQSMRYTTKKGGSGLGISICHNVLKEHGGKFSITNGKFGGCVSKVTLPAKRLEQ